MQCTHISQPKQVSVQLSYCRNHYGMENIKLKLQQLRTKAITKVALRMVQQWLLIMQLS